MSVIAQTILTLIQVAPTAITQILALYEAVKSDISSDDQATIGAALASAQNTDAVATAKADVALAVAAQE